MAGIGRQRELATAISVCQKQIERMNKIIEEYPIKLEERLDETAKGVITEWYSSYEPYVYDRTRSLYHTYKIIRNGLSVSVDFDVEYMQNYSHRVSNEYIYKNSFILGYHGGADSISGSKVKSDHDNHPSPGTPYWRYPTPYFNNWGSPAIQTFSPYERMLERMQLAMDEVGDELISDLTVIVERIARTVTNYLR